MFDITLSLLQAALALSLGVLGFYVTVKPVTDAKKQRRYVAVFVVLCGVGLGLVVWSGLRAKAAQESAQKSQEALRVEVVSARTETTEAARQTIEIRREAHTIAQQLTSMGTKLEPFLEAAKSRHPGLAEDDALHQFAAELKEVRKLSEPVSLSFGLINARMEADAYVIDAAFVPSKEGPVGDVDVEVALAVGSKARIVDIEGSLSSGIGGVVASMRGISADGKSAGLTVNVGMGGNPGVKIELSEPAVVRITGNRGLGVKVVVVPPELRKFRLFGK